MYSCLAKPGLGQGLTRFFYIFLYLPADRQVLNILSILSKKWDFLYYELSRLRRNFFDRINKINKIFLLSLYPEHPVYPV